MDFVFVKIFLLLVCDNGIYAIMINERIFIHLQFNDAYYVVCDHKNCFVEFFLTITHYMHIGFYMEK